MPPTFGRGDGLVTRKVRAWRPSNTMHVAFCMEALQEALSRFCRLEIFNIDQGGRFTLVEFTDVLRGAQTCIFMERCRRRMDKVFIKSQWRSLKYKCAYLHAFETNPELWAG